MTTINELVTEASSRAKANGWHDDMPDKTDPTFNLWVTTKLMLVSSELVEAMEELRAGNDVERVYAANDGKPEGFLVEVADAFIRLADLVGATVGDVDLEEIIEQKLNYNDTRGKRHGGKSI